MFCALSIMYLRERLVETESAISSPFARKAVGVSWAALGPRARSASSCSALYTGCQVRDKQREGESLLDLEDIVLGYEPRLQWNGKDVLGVVRPEVPGESIPDLRASHRIPTSPPPQGRLPTENPRTRRHSPAHGGTAATMAVLVLTSPYAGSAGLTPLTARVAPATTDLLLTGRL
jgi:hypothetical protein